MSTARLLIVHALSPLHVGVGQSTAAVDLPIARERATDLPLIPGSSLKGTLRARAREQLKEQDLFKLFGPETENASEYAGSVALTDARLLLMPIRSVAGTFAWVTSPYLLSGLRRDAELCGLTIPKLGWKPKTEQCMACGDNMIEMTMGAGIRKVILEEFDLQRVNDPLEPVAEPLAELVFPGKDDEEWREILKKRLCVVHDDVMSFLYTHGTSIVTRVHIDPETGTAMEGQLWTEESLPSEAILVGLVEEMPNGKTRAAKPGALLQELSSLMTRPIQLGGKATVGKGRCALRLQVGR